MVLKYLKMLHNSHTHAILVNIRRVNSMEHGTKVETVRKSPVDLIGQAYTKSVYSKISSLLQYTSALV